MNSVEKICWILKRLGERPFELGLTELSKEMGYSKGGIYKILNVLVAEGFVIQNPSTKKYHLGPALYRLGAVYSDQKGIWEISEPIMKAISEITQGTMTIGIREGNDAILAYKIESPNAVSYHGKIGRKFPINAGAIGKLLSAYNDLDVVKDLIKKKPLKKYTGNTVTDPKLLLDEYKRIRENGYALSDEENTLGAFGISAPIHDKNGEVLSCLCLVVLKNKVDRTNIKNWIDLIVNGANEISYRLGYHKY